MVLRMPSRPTNISSNTRMPSHVEPRVGMATVLVSSAFEGTCRLRSAEMPILLHEDIFEGTTAAKQFVDSNTFLHCLVESVLYSQ